MDKKLREEVQTAAQAIYDKKGMNITVLDVTGVCSLTDYFIIAEGNVDRHVKALASEVVDCLRIEHGRRPFVTEGKMDGEWVVVDFGDLIIHLFTSELRQHYNIENVWKAGKLVHLEFKDRPAKEGDYDV